MPLFFLILATVITAAVSQLIFKAFALKNIASTDFYLANIIQLLTKIIQDPLMLLAIALYGSGFIFWLYLITQVKLSIVYPLVAASIVTLVVLGSSYFYKEVLTSWQLGGVLVTVIGLFLILWN